LINWVIQEKIDGSNLSYSINTEEEQSGANRIAMYCGNSYCANSVFFASGKRSLEFLDKKKLINPEYMHYVEYVSKHQHNRVVYDRIPEYFIMAYDLQKISGKEWLDEDEMRDFYDKIGIETTQLFWDNRTGKGTCAFLLNAENSTDGKVHDPYTFITDYIMPAIADGRLKSKLGGKIEGAILKHRHYYNVKTGKTTYRRRKFVTEEFEEQRSSKKPNAPLLSVKSHINWIGSKYDVPARFCKPYQRLRDLAESSDQKSLYKSLEYISKSLDEDLIKERYDEIMLYLRGDFWMRCRKANQKNNCDIDLKDEWLQRIKKLDNEEQLWDEFKGDIFRASRASLQIWVHKNDTQEWLEKLFS